MCVLEGSSPRMLQHIRAIFMCAGAKIQNSQKRALNNKGYGQKVAISPYVLLLQGHIIFFFFFVLSILNTSVSASLAQWLEHLSRKPEIESSNLSSGCGQIFSLFLLWWPKLFLSFRIYLFIHSLFVFQSVHWFIDLFSHKHVLPCYSSCLSLLFFFVSFFVLFVLSIKVAQNSFQHIPRLRFWCVVITTLYQLMLQAWYQKTAQSLVNMLVLFLWHNRLP